MERVIPAPVLGPMLFDVSYLGNRTTGIWLGYQENPSVYIPATALPASTD